MYKIEWKKELVVLATMTLVTIATLVSYPYLGQTLPIHWNLQGAVDQSVAKGPVPAFFPLGLVWGIYFLLLYTPFIDPKRNRYEQFLDAYRVNTIFDCHRPLRNIHPDNRLEPGISYSD
jgi:uncharacterized membrane protein